MFNLFNIVIVINVLIVGIHGFLSHENSVQTCFTRDKRPAVCIHRSVCKKFEENDDPEHIESICADKQQICCPIGNEMGSTDAFIVPRWEFTDWFVNWTYPFTSKPVTPSPPSIVYPPYSPPKPIVPVNIVNISSENVPGVPSATTGSICGARPNINQKDMDDLGFIVGGNTAHPHSWPWTVAVYSNNRFICGAAVIDQRYVLCAAHCVSHSGRITRAEQIVLQIGAHDRKNSGKPYKVEKIIVHSGYNERIMQNDISMFKLERPLTFDNTVSPVCLPPNANACTDANKQMAYLAGWGTTSAGGSTSMELREVAVPVIQLRDCQRAYDSTMVTSKNICAGYLGVGGKDSCQGDSGGPMVVRPNSTQNQYYQCGIVSWGRGCAESRYPGVYTKVSEFVDWIRANKV